MKQKDSRKSSQTDSKQTTYSRQTAERQITHAVKRHQTEGRQPIMCRLSHRKHIDSRKTERGGRHMTRQTEIYRETDTERAIQIHTEQKSRGRRTKGVRA